MLYFTCKKNSKTIILKDTLKMVGYIFVIFWILSVNKMLPQLDQVVWPSSLINFRQWYYWFLHIVVHVCATLNEQPSNLKTMQITDIASLSEMHQIHHGVFNLFTELYHAFFIIRLVHVWNGNSEDVAHAWRQIGHFDEGKHWSVTDLGQIKCLSLVK